MEEGSIFSRENDGRAVLYEIPLAERMRPETLDNYVGQAHILAPENPCELCSRAAKSQAASSTAPRCGKDHPRPYNVQDYGKGAS